MNIFTPLLLLVLLALALVPLVSLVAMFSVRGRWTWGFRLLLLIAAALDVVLLRVFLHALDKFTLD